MYIYRAIYIKAFNITEPKFNNNNNYNNNNNCLKMYKISHEVINFIEKTMKT